MLLVFFKYIKVTLLFQKADTNGNGWILNDFTKLPWNSYN